MSGVLVKAWGTKSMTKGTCVVLREQGNVRDLLDHKDYRYCFNF